MMISSDSSSNDGLPERAAQMPVGIPEGGGINWSIAAILILALGQGVPPSLPLKRAAASARSTPSNQQ